MDVGGGGGCGWGLVVGPASGACSNGRGGMESGYGCKEEYWQEEVER